MKNTKSVVIVGIAGISGSGKTFLAGLIKHRLESRHRIPATVISMDDCYSLPPLSPEERNVFDFDLPELFDYQKALMIIEKLTEGEEISIPGYDYGTGCGEEKKLLPSRVIIVEGLYLYNTPLDNIFDLKLFADCDIDEALCRRILRDGNSKTRYLNPLQNVEQYIRTVKKHIENDVLPQKKKALSIKSDDGIYAVMIIRALLEQKEGECKTK